MKNKLIYPIVVVVFAAACGGDGEDGKAVAGQQYETVQEGSAAGVTSSIGGPGQTLPPITDTNADTTSAFALNPNAAPMAPQQSGAVAGMVPPSNQPVYTGAATGGMSPSYTPPPRTTAPSPAPQRPTYTPPPMTSSSTPAPQPPPAQNAAPAPQQPAEPAEGPAPGTDTSATNTAPPPPAQTATAPPPPEKPQPPQEQEQEESQDEEPAEEPPPPPPAR